MKLDEVTLRVTDEDAAVATVKEVVRLGFRGDVTDEDKAQAILEGRYSPTGAEAQSLMAEYQDHWKLDLDAVAQRLLDRDYSVTGYADRPTLDSVWNRMCGVPDIQRAEDGTVMEARWLDSCKNDLKWHVDYSAFSESTFGLGKDEVEAEFVQAAAEYMLLFDCKLTRVATRSEAHLQESFARLGGSTLGIHYLANNTCSPKTGQFNIMRWPSLDYLGQVIRHEWGHGFGAHHKPGRTLMNPSIVWPLDNRVQGTGFTQVDVDWIRALGYGPGKPPEQPQPKERVAGHVLTKDGRRLSIISMSEALSHVRRSGEQWQFRGHAVLSDGTTVGADDIAEIVTRVTLN